MKKKIRENAPREDVLLEQKQDRRLLSNVPDRKGERSNVDRRGKTLSESDVKVTDLIEEKKKGIRYRVSYQVEVRWKDKAGKKRKISCQGIDISMTGILLKLSFGELYEELKDASRIKVFFEILPGSMPEGFEMKVKSDAYVRRCQKLEDGTVLCGVEFKRSLAEYAKSRKDRYMLMISSLLLLFITGTIVLMRAESVIYFKFNKWFYFYSIVAACFLLSRYLFACFYRAVPINPEFTPGVSILIPCFNEEEWIQRTIVSCVNQDYPIEQLEIIVIDDCSTDGSVQKIKEIQEKLYEEDDHFATKDRIKCIVLEQNSGKREALIAGAEVAKHDLVVFVDSDSFLDPFAIRNLVQPFQDKKMGGVAGRTDVANTYTNNLTRMQSVRYYIAFRVMKAAESCFDTVSCLSGPLSCYKRSIIMENKDRWKNQRFLGQKATFGDDRAMTNFVLEHHRTAYQDTAVCSTIVPNRYKVFLKQQMRWKRSWLRESIIAAKYMWRKEALAALTFYMGLIVPILAPVVVLYNLVYVPITHHIFPTTFLVGILMMSMLMSAAQLFLRRSSTWLFGMLFCIYYEAVLLWQMPIAWVTFWKSTWGTRMTPSDVEEEKKKAEKQKQKEQKKKSIKKTGVHMLFLLCLCGLLTGCSAAKTTAEQTPEEQQIAEILEKLPETEKQAQKQGKARIAEKQLALIFEGTQTPEIMEELTQLLVQKKVPAVFFMPGVSIKEDPAAAEIVAEKGLTLGNYGLLGEKDAQEFDTERLVRETYRSQLILEELTGEMPVLCRMNSSEYTEEMLKVFGACGLEYAVVPSSYLNYKSFQNQYEAEGFARKTERGSILCIKLDAELDEKEFVSKKNDVQDKEPVQPEDAGEILDTTATQGEQLLQMLRWLLDGYEAEKFKFVTVEELARQDTAQEKTELDEETLRMLSAENYPLPVTEEPFGIPEGTEAEDSYFDDVVFVGDSVSLKLYYYVLAQRQKNPKFLGDAQFLAASSLGASNALWEVSEESVHPVYQGNKMPIEDAVALTGKKKVYLMLGMNDISNYDTDTCIDNYQILIDLIKEKSPGCEIYIQSVTPKIRSAQDGVDNEQIFAYDLRLVQMCLEQGYQYVDVAYAIRDEKGDLPEEYCSDPDTMGMHFTDEACDIWISYLRNHTGE